MQRREFFLLVGFHQRTLLPDSGVSEFSRVLHLLDERAPSGSSAASIGPEWATESRRLFVSDSGVAQVWALSPSSATLTRSFTEISDLPAVGAHRRRFVARRPNRCAVVLWVQCGLAHALLGADLENESDPLLGWSAILSSRTRPTGRARLFKVPHHGSATADDPGVWSVMLTEDPVALLTPFSRLREPLPTRKYVRRLLRRTPHVYCSCHPRTRRPARRSGMIERQARAVVRERRAISGPVGHVRVRVRMSTAGTPSVGLFGGALSPSMLQARAECLANT